MEFQTQIDRSLYEQFVFIREIGHRSTGVAVVRRARRRHLSRVSWNAGRVFCMSPAQNVNIAQELEKGGNSQHRGKIISSGLQSFGRRDALKHPHEGPDTLILNRTTRACPPRAPVCKRAEWCAAARRGQRWGKEVRRRNSGSLSSAVRGSVAAEGLRMRDITGTRSHQKEGGSVETTRTTSVEGGKVFGRNSVGVTPPPWLATHAHDLQAEREEYVARVAVTVSRLAAEGNRHLGSARTPPRPPSDRGDRLLALKVGLAVLMLDKRPRESTSGRISPMRRNRCGCHAGEHSITLGWEWAAPELLVQRTAVSDGGEAKRNCNKNRFAQWLKLG
ncbi:hypothetical protein C8R44DRAFT_738741 [Mycena epipterygia]|nr:hypothetical protein C8R44DRAFT_738741 [Mycena epipterygia]